jgi:hypothetical protein
MARITRTRASNGIPSATVIAIERSIVVSLDRDELLNVAARGMLEIRWKRLEILDLEAVSRRAAG